MALLLSPRAVPRDNLDVGHGQAGDRDHGGMGDRH
jgi:hypothetical protein